MYMSTREQSEVMASATGLSMLVQAASVADVDESNSEKMSVSTSSLQPTSINAPKSLESVPSLSGRWTSSEHDVFMKAMRLYGREWKRISTWIPTRTPAQIRSHAQKYFAKISKEQEQSLGTDVSSDGQELLFDNALSMLKNPSGLEGQVTFTLSALQERYKLLLRARGLPRNVKTFKSEETVARQVGAASAALDLEQKQLRKAAEARYKLIKQQNKCVVQPSTTTVTCANVSLISMPSMDGGFDSSQVIALSSVSFRETDRVGDIHTPRTVELECRPIKRVRETLCLVEDSSQPFKRSKKPDTE